MALAKATKLEKENLEVHVDMCAFRYESLEGRLVKVEDKLTEITDIIHQSQQSMTKTIFTSTATIVAAAISVIVAIAMRGGF
jgi:hypothetical protein